MRFFGGSSVEETAAAQQVSGRHDQARLGAGGASAIIRAESRVQKKFAAVTVFSVRSRNVGEVLSNKSWRDHQPTGARPNDERTNPQLEATL